MIYSICRDITEEKDYEDDLIKAKEEALNAADAKRTFLPTTSHEIRTPMNAVIGMSQLLLEEKLRIGQEENLRILNFTAKNLLAIINDILDYNNLKSGQLLFDLQPFNKEALIELKKNNYDLILMDIQMPNIDGYEASRLIRKLPDETNSNIPIIALSADVLEDVRAKVLESGMNKHASQPLNPIELFQKNIQQLS